MSFKEKINKEALPMHVAIIMDGNGRWAKEKGEVRVFGHQNGVHAVREALEGAVEIGVPYITLYAFSTENWNRPKQEIDALMEILVNSLSNELETFQKNNIRINAIGHLGDLPQHCQLTLQDTIGKTSQNSGTMLTLALSYGSRKEITDAIKTIATKVKNNELTIEDISDDIVSKHLYTKDIPDPDLMIRTSGEQRISNYMLWQMAYTELIFLPIMWPEFTREHLFECIYNFQNRERRFGKTGEQL